MTIFTYLINLNILFYVTFTCIDPAIVSDLVKAHIKSSFLYYSLLILQMRMCLSVCHLFMLQPLQVSMKPDGVPRKDIEHFLSWKSKCVVIICDPKQVSTFLWD